MSEARPLFDAALQAEINRQFVKNYPIRAFDFRPNWNDAVDKQNAGDEITTLLDARSKFERRFESTNQDYGLHAQLLVPLDYNDRRFFKGKIECDICKTEAIIRQATLL